MLVEVRKGEVRRVSKTVEIMAARCSCLAALFLQAGVLPPEVGFLLDALNSLQSHQTRPRQSRFL